MAICTRDLPKLKKTIIGAFWGEFQTDNTYSRSREGPLGLNFKFTCVFVNLCTCAFVYDKP